ncbi:glycosyltransferase family 4 protein [Dietzia sp. PP-33]|uniref:glycosyltransferase family 4 protein n=1 Tax=Dietzia sp. PP-33 TaxID=2957500 RepID=UPI0029AFCDAE|nr:glycosyltransferase family 4 protein [Dietzia sp. PP-33]MDX2358770.1 glycosyltransferase family 4 protein [Dietzia sp. PP-33]
MVGEPRKSRVLVLNHFAAPRGQAGGTRHVEMFSRLEGWDHLIIAADKNHLTGRTVFAEAGLLPVSTVSYSSNGLRRILNWASYSWGALWAGLRQGKIDIIYASSPHLLAGLAGLILAKVRRVPFVLEIRDLWPQILLHMGQMSETQLIYRALTRLEEALYRHADRVVVMAPGTEVELVGRGIPAHKIVYIPNGADPEDFVPSAERAVLRDRYGFTRLTAVYAGAHGPANGLGLVLAAAEEAAHLPLDIVLVGSGVAKPALQEQAAAMKLENVRFIDPIPKTEIADILSAADLGLHILADVELFRTAVSPNKLFDYMAAGLPILTNSPGLVGDWVVSAGCGWTVTPGELAEGLRAFTAEDEAGRNAFGQSGQDWLRTNQSRSAMAKRLADMFAEVKQRN